MSRLKAATSPIELAGISIASAAASGAAVIAHAIPDARRLSSTSSVDLLAVVVVPLLLSSVVVFVIQNPGVEALCILASSATVAGARAAALYAAPLLMLMAVLKAGGAEGAIQLSMRNVCYGYAICTLCSLAYARRSSAASTSVVIILVFFPGEGLWARFATFPTESSSVAINSMLCLAFTALGLAAYLVRVRLIGQRVV